MFNGTLLWWKIENQRNCIMKTKRPFVKVMLFNEIINFLKPNFDIGIFFNHLKFLTIHIILWTQVFMIHMPLKWHHIDECNKNYQKFNVLTLILVHWAHLSSFLHPIGWRNWRNYCWTTFCSKYKIKLWGIKIPSGNNGGR